MEHLGLICPTHCGGGQNLSALSTEDGSSGFQQGWLLVEIHVELEIFVLVFLVGEATNKYKGCVKINCICLNTVQIQC